MAAREHVTKASVVTFARASRGSPSGWTAQDEQLAVEQAGALSPPHAPEWYATFYEKNTALRPVIDSITTNVEGHGYRLVPRMDLKAADTVQRVGVAMAIDRLQAARPLAPLSAAIDHMPTKGEVRARLKRLELEMEIERTRIEALFSAITPGIVDGLIGDRFVEMRKSVRRDRLTMGNGFITALRDGANEVAELHHVLSSMMRVRPYLGGLVDTTIPVRLHALRVVRVPKQVRFRTFAQVGLTRIEYYRSFGDPRPISGRTGQLFESFEKLRGAGHPLAPEVLWFKERTPSARTVYGVPPWKAADAAMSGMRDAQDLNAMHFHRKGVPQMVVLVNGALANKQLETRVKEYFAETQGLENYDRILILSAAAPAGAAPGARVTIEIKPLAPNIPDDARFQKYEANSASTVREQFRIAKLILGLGENINRATAEAILQFLEDQVFGPLRREFDEVINGLLLDMGIVHWTFVSNSPIAGNPRDQIEIAKAAAETGAPTFNELRQMVGTATKVPMPPIHDAYTGMPVGWLRMSAGAGVIPDTDPESLEGNPDAPPVTPAEAETIARELSRHKDAVAGAGVPLKIHGSRTLAFLLPESAIRKLTKSAGRRARAAA